MRLICFKKKVSLLLFGIALTTVGILSSTANKTMAATITFEADMGVSGYTPQDDLVISNQFEADFGVTFGLDTNGNGLANAGAFPTLERIGTYSGDTIAFGSIGGIDSAAPGFEAQLGEFFLKMPGLNQTTAPSLMINYSNPVAAASGEIWDIDGGGPGFEQWRIEVFDQNLAIIETLDSPIGNNLNLDGKPWEWSLDRNGVADISAIRVTSIGTTPGGFAFNNFSPAGTDVPEPASIMSLLLVGGAIAGLKRKQNNNA